jgi:hypothetical protein
MSCGGCPRSWLGWTHCWDNPAFFAPFVPFFDPQMGRPDNDACAIGLHPFGRLPTAVLQPHSVTAGALFAVVRIPFRPKSGETPERVLQGLQFGQSACV